MVSTYFSPGQHKLIIYQLLVRLFGNKSSRNKPYGTVKENGCGKFNDITEKALLELNKLGATHIWFTGVLEHSTLTDYKKHGIIADNPYIVKGRAGSPYAIRDYYDVCSDFAMDVDQRVLEFEALLNRTHQIGMKAIIDFVPNHVARSYRSDKKPNGIIDFGEQDNATVLFHPDNNFLYLQGEAFKIPDDYIPLGGNSLPKSKNKFTEFPARVTGNDVYSAQPSSNDWFETIKLNFGIDPNPPHQCFFDPIPNTWQMLLDIILYWCKKGVDGFRCDMAEMVPPEFWEWLIPCVKTHFPEVIFIAEIYKPELYERYIDKGCFDYLYDKVKLYDTLTALLRGQSVADNLTACAESVDKYPERLLNFLENHDEERLAWSGFTGDGKCAIPAMVVCATISKGPVMIYSGQEVGEPAEGNLGFAGARGRTTIFDYAGIPKHQLWMNKGKFDGAKLDQTSKELRVFYSQLLNLCKDNIAISEGSFYDLQYINRFNQSEGYDEKFIYSYLRYTEKYRVLIVVNFNKMDSYKVAVKIPETAWLCMKLNLNKKYRFSDLLSSNYDANFVAKEIANVKDRDAGVYIEIPAMGAYILKID